MIQLPPPERPLVDPKTGKMDYRWRQAFDELVTLLNASEDPVFTVAQLPEPKAGRRAFVSDASGGAVPAFGDGTDWRRVTDRTIVS